MSSQKYELLKLVQQTDLKGIFEITPHSLPSEVPADARPVSKGD
jgi:hypothetical protein